MAKKKSLHPDSVLLCAHTFCPSYKGGGHAALLHTIPCKLYHPGNPKGGHGTMPPPKFASGRKRSHSKTVSNTAKSISSGYTYTENLSQIILLFEPTHFGFWPR